MLLGRPMLSQSRAEHLPHCWTAFRRAAPDEEKTVAFHRSALGVDLGMKLERNQDTFPYQSLLRSSPRPLT